jgi:hypothetical protein
MTNENEKLIEEQKSKLQAEQNEGFLNSIKDEVNTRIEAVQVFGKHKEYKDLGTTGEQVRYFARY